MEMKDLFEMHKRILEEMHEIYCRKNHDYGDSMHDTYLRFGSQAYLVRMYDKLNRLCVLTNGKERRVSDETIHDTLLDLANYAICMSMELRLDGRNLVEPCLEEKYHG